jgi:hypothetical protein
MRISPCSTEFTQFFQHQNAICKTSVRQSVFVHVLPITYTSNTDVPPFVVHFIKDTIVTIAFAMHASPQMFDTGRSRFVLKRDD